MKRYILNGKVPVEEPDLAKWGDWFEKLSNRQVAVSRADIKMDGDPVGFCEVSTVFLGLDHNLSGEGDPVLFETMVFGGPMDGEEDRCCTWEGAEQMHQKMCERVRLAYKEMNS